MPEDFPQEQPARRDPDDNPEPAMSSEEFNQQFEPQFSEGEHEPGALPATQQDIERVWSKADERIEAVATDPPSDDSKALLRLNDPSLADQELFMKLRQPEEGGVEIYMAEPVVPSEDAEDRKGGGFLSRFYVIQQDPQSQQFAISKLTTMQPSDEPLENMEARITDYWRNLQTEEATTANLNDVSQEEARWLAEVLEQASPVVSI